MASFKKLSIKYKLAAVVLLTATIGLTLASAALLSYDRMKRKQTLSEEMQILSQVVAQRSAVALSFGDKKNARANLDTLRVRSSIQIACMFDQTGKVFVEFSQKRSELTCPHRKINKGQFFTADYLEVYQPIERNNAVIGHVYIRTNLQELDDRLIQQFFVSLLILFVSLSLAFGLTARLQRSIYHPIIRLGNVPKEITSGNYQK